MAGVQDVLDQAALVIGGTNYAPASNAGVKVYSGYLTGDSTGVAGIHAAYSSPPMVLEDPPVAILFDESFTAKLNAQGLEENIDNIKIWVLVSPNDPETQYPNLTPFRDLVPTAFRAKMQLNATTNVGEAFIDSGKRITADYGGTKYIAYEFNLRVRRYITAVTYTP